MYNAPAGYKGNLFSFCFYLFSIIYFYFVDKKDEEPIKVKQEQLVTIDLDPGFKSKLELPLEQNITMDLNLDNLRDLSRRDKKYFLK